MLNKFLNFLILTNNNVQRLCTSVVLWIEIIWNRTARNLVFLSNRHSLLIHNENPISPNSNFVSVITIVKSVKQSPPDILQIHTSEMLHFCQHHKLKLWRKKIYIYIFNYLCRLCYTFYDVFWLIWIIEDILLFCP